MRAPGSKDAATPQRSSSCIARLRASGLANVTMIAIVGGAVGLAGVNGCLDFGDYHLVDGPIGGGGFGGTGGFGGVGGTSSGGGGASCTPSTDDGAVTVAYVVAEGATSSGNACGADGATPGIDVVSLDAIDGSCIASALVAASTGTIVGGAPSVRFDRAGDAFIAGAFRKGTLSFPSSCSGPAITLDGMTGTTAALYFAELQKQGSTFCTVWAKRAFTSDAGAGGKLHVEASFVDAQAGLGVTGTLGSALVHFGDAGDSSTDVAGGPFFATFATDGKLVAAIGLASAASTDASLGLASRGGAWLTSGVVENARPACHACSGVDAVSGSQPKCAGSGSGGGGASGTGGAAGTGGSGGSGTVDAPNAMLWQPGVGIGACAMSTSGSDTDGGNPQVGLGVALEPAAEFCEAYWTGLAGTASWSIGSVGLFAGGQTEDGFIAALGADAEIGCNGASNAFTARLVPSIAGATVWGHRVAPLACSAGPVATSVVRNAAGGRVGVHRCTGSGAMPCDVDGANAPLADGAADQLLVTGLDATGALRWSGAIGPLAVDLAAAPLPGRAQDDLATDDRGQAYVVVTTNGALVTEHLDAGPCDLVSTTDAGTWLVALDGVKASGKASCVWAKRLGP